MKSLRIAFVVTFVLVAFLCIGFAAALSQSEAQVHNFFDPQNPQPGQTVTSHVFFTSNTSDSLQITSVGLNFDWMGSNNFVGLDLSSAPVTIAAGSTYGFSPMLISIPANVSVGIHNYYIEVTGTQGTSATSFTWDSPTLSVLIVGSNGQTSGPTVTTSPTSGGQPSGQSNLLLYGAIGAVVVIVVLLVTVLLMRSRRAKPKPEETQPAGQPEAPQPKPEEKPEEKPSSDQDFNI